jgi:hypothetical protein
MGGAPPAVTAPQVCAVFAELLRGPAADAGVIAAAVSAVPRRNK